MKDFNFSQYASDLFLSPLGDAFFFQDSHLTYREFIRKAYGIAGLLKKSSIQSWALKMEAPEELFLHVIAMGLAKKDVLILAPRLSEAATLNIQKNFAIECVLDLPLTNEGEDPELNLTIGLHDPLFSLLTSGSSGRPKKISLSLANVASSARAVIEAFHMGHKDATFLNLPTHHIGGLMILWRAFFSASSITQDEKKSYQFISLVPLQLKRALDSSGQFLQSLQNCRAILIGGAPLSFDLKKRALSLGLKIFETYGMTETSSLVLLNGRPCGEAEVQLGADSELMIKGPMLSRDAALDDDGFYHTKDWGECDSEGRLHFKGRSDLFFKSAGELINPQEIETLVKELPWIEEAIVVPLKHPEWTAAATLLYKSLDPQRPWAEIKAHLKNYLPPFQLPKYYFEGEHFSSSTGIKPGRFEMALKAHQCFFHHAYFPKKGSERLMVFFHGFMEDHTDLLPLMDQRWDTSFLFLDLPGHGTTSLDLFPTREFFFHELTLFIESFKASELLFYGYSMGGRIALELALYHLRPRHLVLESAHLGMETPAQKMKRKEEDLRLFAGVKSLKTFFTHWYENPIFYQYNQSMSYKLDIEKKEGHDFHQWQKSLELFSPGAAPYFLADVIKELALSPFSFSVIVGEGDQKYKAHYREVVTKLQDMDLSLIENAGHNPHKTHLKEVQKILDRVLLNFKD